MSVVVYGEQCLLELTHKIGNQQSLDQTFRKRLRKNQNPIHSSDICLNNYTRQDKGATHPFYDFI